MSTHAVLVSTILARARYLADVENSDNASDTRLIAEINSAHRELYEMVGRADPTRYYKTENAITVAGTATVPLPTDMLFLRQVVWMQGATCVPAVGDGDEVVTGGKGFALERCSDNEVWLYAPGEAWELTFPRYIEEGTNCRFVPPPTKQYGIVFRYVPVPADKTATTDTIELWNGWDDWIVYRLARLHMTKEEQDTSGVSALLGEAQARILGSAAARDEGRPKHVTDVRSERIERRRLYRRGL